MSIGTETAFVTRTTNLAAVLVLGMALPSMAQSAVPAVSARTKRIVLISVPDRKLAVLDSGNVIARFPVAVGAEVSPSPVGDFEVVTHVVNPTYYHKGKIVPAGEGSPVGTRWIGLNVKGYGIHGTNAPHSIGRAASHGCIRLRNRDMEKLFTLVRAGDTVSIRAERDAQIAEVFGEADDTVVASAQVSAPSVGQ
jgi:lipoprotein-anchoring transpeptidase ErfK/SrfK